MFDLIAGVYRQALRDAKAGKQEAIEWLDMCAPDWREIINKPKVKRCEDAPQRKRRGRGEQISIVLHL